jgi:hypothetical protein
MPGLADDGTSQVGRHRRRRRARAAGAGALSLIAHAALFLAILLSFSAIPQRLPPPGPVAVDVFGPARLAGPAPAPSAAPPAPQAAAAAPKTPPASVAARPSPAPPQADSLAASERPSLASVRSLSDSELAGAEIAGSGGGGGGGGQCDMARQLQDALRKDPLVREAVAPLRGKAVKIWDGDWVWLPGDTAKGLMAVRQAMMWEIAFSPAECRARTMHGLVVISPDGGATRLAVGQSTWKWSDLLTPHPGDGELADARP